MCRGERVILTGDFNVGETSRSYAILRDSGILSDTYDTAEIRYAETGTENWFDPDIKTFRRIDYLFVTPGFRVLRYGILTDTYRSENPDGGERKFRPGLRRTTSPCRSNWNSRSGNIPINLITQPTCLCQYSHFSEKAHRRRACRRTTTP